MGPAPRDDPVKSVSARMGRDWYIRLRSWVLLPQPEGSWQQGGEQKGAGAQSGLDLAGKFQWDYRGGEPGEATV